MDEVQKLNLKVQALIQEFGSRQVEYHARIADLMVEAHSANLRVQELEAMRESDADVSPENEGSENQ